MTAFSTIAREWLITLAHLAEQNNARRIEIEIRDGLTYVYADGTLTVEHGGDEWTLSFADLEDERYALTVPPELLGVPNGG